MPGKHNLYALPALAALLLLVLATPASAIESHTVDVPSTKGLAGTGQEIQLFVGAGDAQADIGLNPESKSLLQLQYSSNSYAAEEYGSNDSMSREGDEGGFSAGVRFKINF